MTQARLIHQSNVINAYGVASASFDPKHEWLLYSTAVSDVAVTGAMLMTIDDSVFHKALQAREISVGRGDIMICMTNVKQYQVPTRG